MPEQSTPPAQPRLNLLELHSLFDETKLIRLEDVPKLPRFGRRRGGGRLAPSTAFRWARRGCNGVQLAVIRIGGSLCTTEDALIDFFERCTVPKAAGTRTAAEARRGHDAAMKQLEKINI